MKKIKFLLVSLFLVLCLAGCIGGKTLTCSKSETEDGMKTKMEVVIKFNGNKPNTVKMITELEATNEEGKSQWSMVESTFDAAFKIFNDLEGVTVNTKNDAKKYKYSATVDINLKKAAKNKDSSFSVDKYTNDDATYDKIKSSSEKDGFKCR